MRLHYSPCNALALPIWFVLRDRSPMEMVTVSGAVAKSYRFKVFSVGFKGLLTGGIGTGDSKASSLGGIYTVRFHKLADALAGEMENVADFLHSLVLVMVEVLKQIFSNLASHKSSLDMVLLNCITEDMIVSSVLLNRVEDRFSGIRG